MKALYLALGSLIMAGAFSAPAMAKDTGLIFVSNEKSNEVIVFDKDFNKVKSIATSHRPRDMHFNADHTLLYVACGDDDSIDVIDVAKLEDVRQVPTGPSPEMFELAADGKSFYVSDEEDSRIERIDADSGQSIQDVPTGAEPEGVMLSEDGKTLYATSEVADMVHVIDTTTGTVTKNIVVGTRPRRFVLTPDGKELWVSCELSSEVDVIDRATNTVTAQLTFVPPGFREEDVTPVGMTITKDGSKVLLTLGRANNIAIVDAHTKKVLSYVLVGKRAWGVGLSADEKMAIVTNGLSDDITVVDMTTMKPVKSISDLESRMKMQFLRRLGVAICLIFLAPATAMAQAASTLSGPAEAIGPDIIKVADTRVILLGIDAPEANQPCYEPGNKMWKCADTAFAVLDQTVKQGTVTCTLKGNPDPLGRRNGTCMVGGQDVADTMVKQGLALAYPRDPESKNYTADQAAAKAGKQGLWADGVIFDNPWEFRLKHNHSPIK